jgi:hypothetical protein
VRAGPGNGVDGEADFDRSDHQPTIPITATNTRAANSCQRIPSSRCSMSKVVSDGAATMIVGGLAFVRNEDV